jgi:hypothetical protein
LVGAHRCAAAAFVPLLYSCRAAFAPCCIHAVLHSCRAAFVPLLHRTGMRLR